MSSVIRAWMPLDYTSQFSLRDSWTVGFIDLSWDLCGKPHLPWDRYRPRFKATKPMSPARASAWEYFLPQKSGCCYDRATQTGSTCWNARILERASGAALVPSLSKWKVESSLKDSEESTPWAKFHASLFTICSFCNSIQLSSSGV